MKINKKVLKCIKTFTIKIVKMSEVIKKKFPDKTSQKLFDDLQTIGMVINFSHSKYQIQNFQSLIMMIDLEEVFEVWCSLMFGLLQKLDNLLCSNHINCVPFNRLYLIVKFAFSYFYYLGQKNLSKQHALSLSEKAFE